MPLPPGFLNVLTQLAGDPQALKAAEAGAGETSSVVENVDDGTMTPSEGAVASEDNATAKETYGSSVTTAVSESKQKNVNQDSINSHPADLNPVSAPNEPSVTSQVASHPNDPGTDASALRYDLGEKYASMSFAEQKQASDILLASIAADMVTGVFDPYATKTAAAPTSQPTPAAPQKPAQAAAPEATKTAAAPAENLLAQSAPAASAASADADVALRKQAAELMALDVADAQEAAQLLVTHLRHIKTAQQAAAAAPARRQAAAPLVLPPRAAKKVAEAAPPTESAPPSESTEESASAPGGASEGSSAVTVPPEAEGGGGGMGGGAESIPPEVLQQILGEMSPEELMSLLGLAQQDVAPGEALQELNAGVDELGLPPQALMEGAPAGAEMQGQKMAKAAMAYRLKGLYQIKPAGDQRARALRDHIKGQVLEFLSR